jgi:ATP-dependent DNA helicase 2 subunit 2
LLATAETIEAVKDASGQMEKIIEGHIRTSFGDSNYDRAVEELGVLREELVDYEEPELYNDIIRRIKDKILKEQLGGDRQELWWLIRRSKIGLIDKSVSDRSEVTEEETKQVRRLLFSSL